MQEAKKADPLRQREQCLSREQSRLQNKIDRLLTAYQEELITLEQLRQRMPELRKQEQAVRSELQSLHMAAQDQSRYLRLVDSLANFRTQLQNNADRLDVIGRRKIIRLLVKEILVGTDTITVRHSIPLPSSTPRPTDPVPPPAGPPQPSASGDYLLCTRGDLTAPREHLLALRFRPMGERVAQEVRTRRHDRRPIRRRPCFRLSAPYGSRPFSERFPGTAEEVWTGAQPGQNAPDRVRAVCRTTPGKERGRKAGTVRLSGFHAY